jgi:glycosyltransferase involved in cell wall biosynthesis
MRIGVFVLMAGREAGGPETYEVELIRALAAMDRRNEYVVYCTTPAAIDAIGVTQDNVTYRLLRPAIRAISVSVTMPMLMVRDGIDFFHATFTPPPMFTKRLVFTMHCFSNFARPDFYNPIVAWRLNQLMKIALKRAAQILCVSGSVLDEVHRAFRVPRDRLSVVYNGVGSHFVHTPPEEARRAVKERFGIDYPYLLFVGKLQARKNVRRLIEGYAIYRRETGSDARLLLAGKRNQTGDDLDQTIARLGLQEHVVQAGYFKPTDLPLLYSGARLFAFPSLFEGFGIPVIEAMACGTPVLTSTVTSLPEVAGDAAVLVDPTSVEAIAEGLVRIERSPDLRDGLIARGLSRAKQFTWQQCARSTLQAYERMNAA